MGSWRTPGWTIWIGVAIGCGGSHEIATQLDGSSSTSPTSTSTTGEPPGSGPSLTSLGTADGTTGTSDAGPRPDLPILDVAGGTTGERVCSGDLMQVLDADTGVALEQCAPDQGCLDGECVEACAAAAGAVGSLGCEFLVPTSPFYANGNPLAAQSGPCHALFVSNPWDRPAVLELSRGGVELSASLVTRIPDGIAAATTYAPLPADGVPSGQVAVVFLSHRPGVWNGNTLECPVAPAVLADTAAHGTAQGEAFSLVSDTPVQVYDIIPYGGAPTYLPSASLLYPSTAWGQGYLVPSPHATDGAEWILAVAREDDTTITIEPTVAMTPGSIADPLPAAVTEYTIDAGQVLQWQSVADPVGTILAADGPIGVFAGNTYLRVTTADDPVSGRDSAHQMIPHVQALAAEHVGAGLYSRLPGLAPESVLYRLMGVVDGTSLAWDPPLPGAPATIDAGEVVELETRHTFFVASQDQEHPFSLAQYMSGTLVGQPGCTDALRPCELGDEDWVMLVPPAQFLRSYAFFVDPTYATSTLVLVRQAEGLGFHDVELACMGTIDGWQPVGDAGRFEFAHVELFRAGVASVPACATSQHLAQSNGSFGVVVWGIDRAASYGYPAGGNLHAINEVDVGPAG